MSSKLDQMRMLREAKYARMVGEAQPRRERRTAAPEPTISQSAVSPTPPNLTLQQPPEPAHAETPAAPDMAQGAVVDTPETGTPEHGVKPGKPVHLYKTSDLIAVVRWVTRDGAPRPTSEIIELAMAELQFVRRGKKIVAAFTEAIAVAEVPVVDDAAA